MTTMQIILLMSIFIVIIVIIIVSAGIRVITPDECGVLLVLGRPRAVFPPGLHYVPPFISKVNKIKMTSDSWEEELDKFKGQEFSQFADQINNFKMDVNKNYGSINKK
jgi:regulator of protease activity HflC (stomatin/prohibitin superfamily)